MTTQSERQQEMAHDFWHPRARLKSRAFSPHPAEVLRLAAAQAHRDADTVARAGGAPAAAAGLHAELIAPRTVCCIASFMTGAPPDLEALLRVPNTELAKEKHQRNNQR